MLCAFVKCQNLAPPSLEAPHLEAASSGTHYAQFSSKLAVPTMTQYANLLLRLAPKIRHVTHIYCKPVPFSDGTCSTHRKYVGRVGVVGRGHGEVRPPHAGLSWRSKLLGPCQRLSTIIRQDSMLLCWTTLVGFRLGHKHSR